VTFKNVPSQCVNTFVNTISSGTRKKYRVIASQNASRMSSLFPAETSVVILHLFFRQGYLLPLLVKLFLFVLPVLPVLQKQ
jgi:hypothetical protein